jgi:hypothetical protein
LSGDAGYVNARLRIVLSFERVRMKGDRHSLSSGARSQLVSPTLRNLCNGSADAVV